MHRIWTFLIGLIFDRLGRSLALDLEATALEQDAERRARLWTKATALRAAGFAEESDRLLEGLRTLSRLDAASGSPLPNPLSLADRQPGSASSDRPLPSALCLPTTAAAGKDSRGRSGRRRAAPAGHSSSLPPVSP